MFVESRTEPNEESNTPIQISNDEDEVYTELNKLKADDSLLEPLKEKLRNLKKENANVNINKEEVDKLVEDDHALRRLLVARTNKVEKAYKMAVETLRWRSELRPAKLRFADFPIAGSQGVWRFAGFAKNGWPVILVKAKLWDPFKYSIAEYVNMVAFFLEANEKRMGSCSSTTNNNSSNPDFRNYLIFDMNGMSYLKSDMLKLRQLAKLLADHYPERLGYALVVNADWVFWAMWKLLAPLVDNRTRAKAFIFRADYKDFLEKHIGLENVGEALGGTRADEWPELTEENQDTFLRQAIDDVDVEDIGKQQQNE
eukprot:CAMPEP_0198140684 /NCGR_PEP_ID=MMETSP1443-20131203/3813_1 /TAXON_ID=186043 /ORGANISM="Entomoneis sp., Strain CCMP2396" /LENGTH=312 /DNA_ID=CAMNT_0043803197 /DNA_START=126 /DNA_END=1064 /DNA_ORIENTATION=+